MKTNHDLTSNEIGIKWLKNLNCVCSFLINNISKIFVTCQAEKDQFIEMTLG